MDFKKLVIQIMDHYSTLKRNELPHHEKKWRKLKCILLSKRSQSEKLHNVYFQVYGIQEKAKLGTVKACYEVKNKTKQQLDIEWGI